MPSSKEIQAKIELWGEESKIGVRKPCSVKIASKVTHHLDYIKNHRTNKGEKKTQNRALKGTNGVRKKISKIPVTGL